jgi:hypothetical protein
MQVGTGRAELVVERVDGAEPVPAGITPAFPAGPAAVTGAGGRSIDAGPVAVAGGCSVDAVRRAGGRRGGWSRSGIWF